MTRTVGPIDYHEFGEPEPCPVCGGRLAPAFDLIVDEDGTRRPVADPGAAICHDCGTRFAVKAERSTW